jgi:hypothetical protein
MREYDVVFIAGVGYVISLAMIAIGSYMRSGWPKILLCMTGSMALGFQGVIWGVAAIVLKALNAQGVYAVFLLGIGLSLGGMLWAGVLILKSFRALPATS